MEESVKSKREKPRLKYLGSVDIDIYLKEKMDSVTEIKVVLVFFLQSPFSRTDLKLGKVNDTSWQIFLRSRALVMPQS